MGDNLGISVPPTDSGAPPVSTDGDSPPSAADSEDRILKGHLQWRAFAPFVIILGASILAPTWWIWANSGHHVTFEGPHDYAAALSNVLTLQQLAISEAETGRPAYFSGHIGCAAPPVWQNDSVLQNFTRMSELDVVVTLVAGGKGFKNDPLPSPNWPGHFGERLAKAMKLTTPAQLYAVYRVMPKELWNHSLVAGSEGNSSAYIASHEKMNIYPTNYFTVSDDKACQEWRAYILGMFKKVPELVAEAAAEAAAPAGSLNTGNSNNGNSNNGIL